MLQHDWVETSRLKKWKGRLYRTCRCWKCDWEIDVPVVDGKVKHGVPSRRKTCHGVPGPEFDVDAALLGVR